MLQRFKNYLGEVKSFINGTSHLRGPFALERALIADKRIPTNDQQSIIHFGINKAATQYIKAVIVKLAKSKGMLHVDFPSYGSATSFPYLYDIDKTQAQYQHLFRPNGLVYAVFGEYIFGIPNMNNYRSIVSIRDPRDVVVSGYYSKAFIHKEPDDPEKKAKFLEERAEAKKLGVDKYSINRAKQLKRIYAEYIGALENELTEATVIKYEDMVTNFEEWLEELIKGTGLQVDQELREQIIQNHREKQNKLEERGENLNNHHRKGKVGDYLEKLKPKTINELDRILKEPIHYFNY